MNLRLVGVLVLIAFAALAIIKYQADKIEALNKDYVQVLVLAKDSARIAKTYINKYGDEISKNKVLNLSAKNLEDLRNNSEFQFIKEFEGVRKSLKNLEATAKVQAEIIQQLKATKRDTFILVGKDTVRAQSFIYQDGMNTIKGWVQGDSVTLVPNIPLDLEIVVYWQRRRKILFEKWRVGRKIYFSEVKSRNKLVDISNSEIMKVERR